MAALVLPDGLPAGARGLGVGTGSLLAEIWRVPSIRRVLAFQGLVTITRAPASLWP